MSEFNTKMMSHIMRHLGTKFHRNKRIIFPDITDFSFVTLIFDIRVEVHRICFNNSIQLKKLTFCTKESSLDFP